MGEYLVISTASDLVRIKGKHIVFISSDGNYSTIVMTNNETRLVTMQLGHLEHLISEQLQPSDKTFIRIGKSLIINQDYIYYINIPKQQLILSDGKYAMHSVSASREALKQVKDFIEKEAKS